MVYPFVVLWLLFVTFLIGQNEHVRYRHAYEECIQQHVADQELLRRDVCYNFEDRLLFKDAVDCEGAEKRLRLNVVMCALHKWARESSMAHVFDTLTGSFWVLFPTIMTPLLFAMYLWKSKSTELAIMDRIERLTHPKKPKKPKKIRNGDTAVCYKYE